MYICTEERRGGGGEGERKDGVMGDKKKMEKEELK
jgi:hypothetical protein